MERRAGLIELPGEVLRKCAPRSLLVQTLRRWTTTEPTTSEKDLSICAQSRRPPSPDRSGAVLFPDHTAVKQEPYPTASRTSSPVYTWPLGSPRHQWRPADHRHHRRLKFREHFIFIDAAYTQVYSSASTVFNQCLLQLHPFAPDMAASSISLPHTGDFVRSVVPWEHNCVFFHCATRARNCSLDVLWERTCVY